METVGYLSFISQEAIRAPVKTPSAKFISDSELAIFCSSVRISASMIPPYIANSDSNPTTPY